jgi:hypothetical protein
MVNKLQTHFRFYHSLLPARFTKNKNRSLFENQEENIQKYLDKYIATLLMLMFWR